MKTTPLFKGVATAVITPFDDNKVDYWRFSRFLEFQLTEGTDAIVVCGTTGEAATLSIDEQKEVIAFVIKQVRKRVPVIAGIGGNDTAKAAEMSKFACTNGVDGLLAVTPYYNKCTQEGLIRHYEKIASFSSKPIILYNVPARTCVNIEPETYAALAEIDNVVAVKEAGGSLSAVAKTLSLCGDKLDIYSGNDDLTLPIMALGGLGVISVSSNIVPRKMKLLCTRFFEGDIEGAAKLQIELIPLMNMLFCEVNPTPIKAALAELGLCKNELRLPLQSLSAHFTEPLRNELKKAGVLPTF